jgi:hypothetical protein
VTPVRDASTDSSNFLSNPAQVVRRIYRESDGGTAMRGFITEQDLDQADEAFPGIRCFFQSLPSKPRTFLELVTLFEHWGEPASEIRQAA